MASVGHIAAGAAAARIRSQESRPGRPALAAVVLWSLLSLLPDVDVIGFSLGINYEDEWGHRGATHSLLFSAVIGAAIGVGARLAGRRALRTGVTAAMLLASHAALDTLTDGGLGCALFWPFDKTRYFAPWNPIPVAPIGAGFISLDGLTVAVIELVIFGPLLWFTFRSPGNPRRWKSRVTAIVVWLMALWFLVSSDPVRERAIGIMLQEDTVFASGFSETALRKTKLGESRAEVRRRLGQPLHELWFYRRAYPNGCYAVAVKNDEVVSAKDSEQCRQQRVQPSSRRLDAERALGRADELCWVYTVSRQGGYYRAREVCFADDRVVDVIRQWHRD